MITIIDYGLGNLASVANALQKFDIPFDISSDPNVLKNAQALILPGVGAAGQGMENLKARDMDKIILEQVHKGIPILGICLGMQLLFSSSKEGNVNCLNLIDGNVRKFQTKLKVPQIGWNEVLIQKSKVKNQKLFKSIPNKSYFYFVHSYYCEPVDNNIIVGTTDYGNRFCSILEKDNIYGVQFHPEKSGDVGLQVLQNFVSIAYGNNSSN